MNYGVEPIMRVLVMILLLTLLQVLIWKGKLRMNMLEKQHSLT